MPKRLERMRMDMELGQISHGRIGDWSNSTLRDIELRAKDEDSAAEIGLQHYSGKT